MKKDFMTRVLAVSLSAAMALSLSTATSLTTSEAAAKKLPANKKAVSISLKVGKSKVLKLNNYKKWNIKAAKSNKPAVAKVKNKGTKAKRTIKVVAKKKGTAKITLTLGKRAVANSKSTKYTKTIKKVVTVKVTKAKTNDTTPTDTKPTDTTPTDTTTNTTPGALNISEVKATKVDTLEVSFSSPVAAPADVKFTITRGSQTIDAKAPTWNADSNVATIETVAKMTKGTYTVTATNGTETTTGTVEVKDQEVKEIKFLHEVALTGTTNTTSGGATECYVYYKVLDQYGEDMKDTVSIQWTSSTGNGTVSANRTLGKLTLKKQSGTFTYGDKVYVTGVYSKTGVSTSGTFTIGTTQSVDKIEYKGFRKKGTTTTTEKLPAGFKNNEYQLLYTALDQNGCELEPDNFEDSTNTDKTVKDKGTLTFISDNVLVVNKVEGDPVVTIGGKDYCAVSVVPGDNVNMGGTVNLSAISTKTGQKSTLNFVVGEYKILKKFVIGSPKSGVVADGETTELEFTATDKDGNAMTNFVEIANQSDFSKLTLNAGSGTLELKEKEDGSAKLEWKDNKDSGNANYWNANSADGIDRPVALTSIVVGGESDNQMLYVSDKARPEAISDVAMSEVMVYDSDQKLSLSRFTFLDQYGRNMKQTYDNGYKMNLVNNRDVNQKAEFNTKDSAADDDGANDGFIYDNGFFYYLANGGNLTANGFNGYKFGVYAESSDLNTCVDLSGDNAKNWKVNDAKYSTMVTNNAETGKFVINKYSDAVIEPTIKFSIRKWDANNVEDVSKKVSKSFKVVSLNNMSSFAIKDIKKFQIETEQSWADTGDEGGKITSTNITSVASIKNNNKVLHDGDVDVSATYNGKTIDVPASYYTVKGSKLVTKTSGLNDKKIVAVTEGSLLWKDLYNSSTARYDRKDASDDVEVIVYRPDSTGKVYLNNKNQLVSLKKTAYISDAMAKPATMNCPDKVTISPLSTFISLDSRSYIMRGNEAIAANETEPKVLTVGRTAANVESGAGVINKLADQATDKVFSIKDQYGETMFEYNNHKDKAKNVNRNMTITYLVKDITENPDGYVLNNFKVNQNSTPNAYIEGAERGDKFTLEITAKDELSGATITKPILVTVGADDYCLISSNPIGNYYLQKDYGVRTMLQKQLDDLYKTSKAKTTK
jgi:hypothetical protein